MSKSYLNSYIYFGPDTLSITNDELIKIYQDVEITHISFEEFEKIVRDFIYVWNTVINTNGNHNYSFVNWCQVPDNDNLWCVIFGNERNNCNANRNEDEMIIVEDFDNLGIETEFGIYRG